MRAQNENLMKEIENLRNENKSIRSDFEAFKGNYGQNQVVINTALNNFQNQRNVDLGNINNRFGGIDEAIRNKRCYVATGKNSWHVCPYGGTYHGGWNYLTEWGAGLQFHLSFAGIGDQEVWTPGNAFLCCN